MFVCLSIDVRNESPVKIKVQEKSIGSHECNEDEISDENIPTEVI